MAPSLDRRSSGGPPHFYQLQYRLCQILLRSIIHWEWFVSCLAGSRELCQVLSVAGENVLGIIHQAILLQAAL